MAALIRLRGRKNTTSPSRRLQSYASTFQYFKSARSHFTSLHFPPFFSHFKRKKLTDAIVCILFVWPRRRLKVSGRSVQIGHILKPRHLRATYQVKSREVNGLFFSFFLEQRRHKSSFSFSQFFKENIPAIQLLLIKKNSSFQITPKAAAHTSTSEDIGASVLCSVTQKKCCPLLHNPVLFSREYQLCDIKHI